MTSILSGLDIVKQSLTAQQFALSVTQRNIANANNPSYTRQDAIFTMDWTQGTNTGIPGISLESNRDRYIDYSISKELQSLGKFNVTYDALRQVDAVVNGISGQNLQQAISNFFDSFGALSGAPEDSALRQQVLWDANALTTEFHRLSDGMQRIQTAQDLSVTDTIKEINDVTARIASLNVKIKVEHGLKSEAEYTLRDDRQQLLEQLSSLMDLSWCETESGELSISTRQGAPLVLGDQSYALVSAPVAGSAFQKVFLDDTDITASLGLGKLGGLIDMRDNKIAGYLSDLDDMAAAIIGRVNAQHTAGSDLDGAPGNDFFNAFVEIIPGSNLGAARSISVALTNPRQIAAATAGSGPGNNENAKLLAGISDELLFSGNTETISQFNAGLIYRIGSDERTADEGITTQEAVLEQLQNQRAAFSGVNMDEEAINIVKYQKAYEASAKYANVLNALSEEILQLLGV
jgi:flagellar hook-associated protein 1